MNKIEKSDKIELEKILKSRLNSEQGGKLMTSLAHHWEQQGVEKGMQIGRNEGMQIGRNEGMQIVKTKACRLVETKACRLVETKANMK